MAPRKRSKKLKIPAATLERVYGLLCLKAATDNDEPTELEDITLMTLRPKAFILWAETMEEIEAEPWGMILEYINGKLIGSELTSSPVATATGLVLRELAGPSGDERLHLSVYEDTFTLSGDVLRPNVLIKVEGTYVGPSVHPANRYKIKYGVGVVQVSLSQSTSDLLRKKDLYSTVSSIQMYAALKRYGSGGMVALVFTRASGWINPVSILSFGPVPLPPSTVTYFTGMGWENLCVGVGFGGPESNVPGNPMYILQLPSSTIYIDCEGGVPSGAPSAYSIDLFYVQRDILRV